MLNGREGVCGWRNQLHNGKKVIKLNSSMKNAILGAAPAHLEERWGLVYYVFLSLSLFRFNFSPLFFFPFVRLFSSFDCPFLPHFGPCPSRFCTKISCFLLSKRALLFRLFGVAFCYRDAKGWPEFLATVEESRPAQGRTSFCRSKRLMCVLGGSSFATPQRDQAKCSLFNYPLISIPTSGT